MKHKIYIQTPDTINRRWRFMGIFIILICLGATYLFWSLMEQSNTRFVEDRLDAHAARVIDDFQDRTEVYGDVLYGGRGLFLIDPELTEPEWDTFMVSQKLFDRYPGLNSIVYFRIDESEETRQITIEYLTPVVEARLTGNNVYTRPELAAMFDMADIRGVPVASIPFLSKNPNRVGMTDVAMALPIYGPDYTTTMTNQEKRDSVRGYVGVSLNPKTLLEQSLGKSVDEGSLRLRVTDDNDILVYDSGAAGDGASITKRAQVSFGGQLWTMQFSVPGDYGLTVREVYAPVLMLIGGLIFMVLFVSVFFYRTGIRIRRVVHTDALDNNHQNN
jgi:hypothetical protein